MQDTPPVAGTGNLSQLHVPSAPSRVVSLVPSVTGSLFDLGLGQVLAAVTDYCVYPPEGVAGLPKIGGTKNPDCDRILALAPDLVIANREQNRRDDVEALQAAGLTVWVQFPNTVREALNVLWATIRVFEAPQRGHSLAALERSYEIASRAAETEPAVPVFCPIWREPATSAGPAEWWMTANRDTYLNDILRICGGANVFAARDRRYPLAADLDPSRTADPPEAWRDVRYPRVTSVEMAATAPEVILLPSEPYPFTEADASAFASFPNVPAVQNGRVHLVDGSMLTWPGTRLALALAELPSVLNPTPIYRG
jgi:ABC-type Fe3+-hydroxamate transport system substrate-binding protein